MNSAAGSRDDRLRILMLNHNLSGEGSFYRCWHLAGRLSSRGMSVTLMTVSPTRRVSPHLETKDGVSILETPNLLNLVYGVGSGYGVLGIPYRLFASLRGRFDVVHAFDHRPNVALPSLVYRRLRKVPLVADWADWWGYTSDGSGLQENRAWPIIRLENALEEYVHTTADYVTTISSGLRNRALALGIPPNRVRWIPSGAPCDEIRPLDQESCRRHLGISVSHFLLGYVGSGVGDLEIVLPVLRRLQKSDPGIRLAVIGPADIFRTLARPEMHGGVIFFDRVPFLDLPTYLGACDAFLLPLRNTVFNRTRWPNKFGDYLAAGRPILCSDVGDAARIVRSQGCGVVWKDLEELHSGVDEIRHDKDLADVMGGRARETAESRVNWDDLAGDFAALYFLAARGEPK